MKPWYGLWGWHSFPGTVSGITRSETVSSHIEAMSVSSAVRVVASGQGDVACGFIGQDKGQAASNCVKKMLVEGVTTRQERVEAGPIGPTRINCWLIGESTFRVSESSLFQDPTLRIDRVLQWPTTRWGKPVVLADAVVKEGSRSEWDRATRISWVDWIVIRQSCVGFGKAKTKRAKQDSPSSSCELGPPLQF